MSPAGLRAAIICALASYALMAGFVAYVWVLS